MYMGPEPESEPEVQHMRDFMLSRGNRLTTYFSLHSHSQKWFTRWDYTASEVPQDHDELVRHAFHSFADICYIVYHSRLKIWIANRFLNRDMYGVVKRVNIPWIRH